MTATELRRNIYNILDEILETGQPKEIIRNGRKILLMPVEAPRRRLADLPRRDIFKGSINELIETSWEDAWQPDSWR